MLGFTLLMSFQPESSLQPQLPCVAFLSVPFNPTYGLFFHLVGTVSNCADAVRLQTAPTGGRKCLFIFTTHHNSCQSLQSKANQSFFLKDVASNRVSCSMHGNDHQSNARCEVTAHIEVRDIDRLVVMRMRHHLM